MDKTNKSEIVLILIFTIILISIVIIVAVNAYKSTNNLHSNNFNIQNEKNNINDKPKNKPDENIDNPDNDKLNEKNGENIDNSDNNKLNEINGENDENNENIDNPDNNINKETEPVELQIAEFSTNIYDNDPNRVHNIKLALEKINNHVIKKEEVFSFNDTVGSMGKDNGYKEAIGFDSNGKKIKIFGGGLCQISSTMYNAALIANLEIVERHPHSRRVYYVPKDKDATIYYGSLDLKFKNITENDIKIIASCDESNVTIILNKIT